MEAGLWPGLDLKGNRVVNVEPSSLFQAGGTHIFHSWKLQAGPRTAEQQASGWDGDTWENPEERGQPSRARLADLDSSCSPSGWSLALSFDLSRGMKASEKLASAQR